MLNKITFTNKDYVVAVVYNDVKDGHEAIDTASMGVANTWSEARCEQRAPDTEERDTVAVSHRTPPRNGDTQP